ncbi:MAG: diacylglycerol/lipid kinase family protein [Candidatus Promineifilaceae bacterium]|jgi:diacylglycerol kinase (ATP)
MPTMIILNPNADLGHGADFLEIIKEIIRPLPEVEIVPTDRSGHARELAKQAVADGYDIVVAAGGDGTINEVVNGIMLSNKQGIKLGIIPVGSGNDFAHSMGVSKDVSTAVGDILNGQTRLVDVGLVEDDKDRRRYFVNNLGVGFDANVIIRSQDITWLRGFPKYMAAVLTTLAQDYLPYHLQVRFDEDEVVSQETLFLYMGVGTRGGGGFLLTPDALHDDDLIDSCTVPMLGRMRLISLISSAIKGTHVNTPYPQMRQNKQIIIHSEEAMPIQIEGEIYAVPEDDVHQIMVTSLPAALEVVV